MLSFLISKILLYFKTQSFILLKKRFIFQPYPKRIQSKLSFKKIITIRVAWKKKFPPYGRRNSMQPWLQSLSTKFLIQNHPYSIQEKTLGKLSLFLPTLFSQLQTIKICCANCLRSFFFATNFRSWVLAAFFGTPADWSCHHNFRRILKELFWRWSFWVI